MKKFIAIMMVLGLVGFAVAQDLDCPTSGVAVPDNVDDQGQAGTAYDTIISKILEKEAQYIGHQIAEGIWMVWGRNYWGWTHSTMANWTSGAQGEAAQESNAMWDQLSPAEAAAAVDVMQQSHQRVLAAGLN